MSNNILIKELNLKEEFYKATTPNEAKDEDNPLRKVNHHCANIRDFLDSHPGFNRDELQDYLNLYSFKYNTKGTNLEKVDKILESSSNKNKKRATIDKIVILRLSCSFFTLKIIS